MSKQQSRQKAIVFDMDGVLVNNHGYHIKAWKEFCQRYHKELSEDEFEQHVTGRPVWDTIRYLFGDSTSQEKIRQLGEEKEEIYRSLYKPHMAPTPGLYPLLDALHEKGWLLAVATSAHTQNLHFVLEGLGISDYFTATADSLGVKRGKPAPDLYLKAAEILEIPPGRCIVFEDSKAGITAATEAGMSVIALSTTHSREELAPTGVRWIFSSFEEVELDLLDRILHELD